MSICFFARVAPRREHSVAAAETKNGGNINTRRSSREVTYFCPILTKIWTYPQILVKNSKHEI